MDYKETLNLPKTDFPMKANLAQNEPKTLKDWENIDLYKKIIEKNRSKKRFVMHDGPPYANGNIHHGHILNKVLKDIVVKFKNMTEHFCEYLPGWDCHGLPIEHQVDKELGNKKEKMTKSEIRKECRKYAQKFIEIQREEFKRLGVFGEWDHPYKTMDFGYEARIAREFGKIVGGKYAYKKKRPVHWCISCATALAEAEVEYEDHKSHSIYVAFPIKTDVKKLGIKQAKADNTYIMIWTTTPWTIPANLAVALNPKFEYSAVLSSDNVYILASKLLDKVAKETGLKDYEILKTFRADDLKDFEFIHPLYKDRVSKIVLAEYVTTDTGTGCVHTAPGHGQEDYETGIAYGLDTYSPVDDAGNFDKTVGFFAGQNVFKANEPITEMLKKNGYLLGSGTLLHSYPHCWRCKNPVIFRATEQWFLSVDHNDLRKKTLLEIDKIEWVPKWGRERIYSMIETRPDWCVSRQRVWGNPLMSLKCKDCDKDQSEWRPDECFNRSPFGDDHPEGCEEHAGNPDEHHDGKFRHPDNESCHILNVPAPDPLLNCSDTEKQERFCDRVEKDQQDCNPHEVVRPYTGTGYNEAEISDSRVGQHFLCIVLRDSDSRSQKEGDSPHEADNQAFGGPGKNGSESDNHVDPCLYHCA